MTLPHHRRLVTVGTLAMAVGLLGLCLQSSVDPVAASRGYGVPVLPGGQPWVTAAGARDGALAVVALLVLRRHRPALPAVIAGTLVLPLADIGISLSAGATVVQALPHVLGAVGLVVLLGLAWTEPRA